jgi:putative Ca2+/H+ antiporter (TMEM165/GDT1 family)
MEAFLVSTGLVALAEVGDKTQLLALVLAARHRKPLAIIAGIFGATLANHALAGSVGAWLATLVGGATLRILVGISFMAMAVWALIPDDEPGEPGRVQPRFGVFATTLVAFFLVEIGDKTQIATVALAARFDALVLVVLGTTLGMLIANVPAVLLGEVIIRRVPLAWIRAACAATFVGLGVLALLAA